jgi:hypothetical protein
VSNQNSKSVPRSNLSSESRAKLHAAYLWLAAVYTVELIVAVALAVIQ